MQIALLADIHGNLPALEAVLAHPAYRTAERAFCLGDVVGYYPAPRECAALLRREGIETILGNHDAAYLEGRPCRDNPVGRASQRLMQKLIDQPTRDFLASLPGQLTVDMEGVRLWLIHGSPADPLEGYLNPADPIEIPSQVDVLAMGHTHRQFARRIGQALAINPGSVGQPRDGQDGACFATLELTSRTVQLHCIHYDHKPALPEE